MAMDKFEEVNAAEDRAEARQRRSARLRAMERAHPVWFTLGALAVVYGLTLGTWVLRPYHPRGSSLFLWSGILTVVVVALQLFRFWRTRRAGGVGSDWT
jgi:hypothetical protein